MKKVDIICELGLNHDGDFQKALQMITAAKAAGVRIVKFQHYDAAKLLGKDSPYYEYADRCQFTKAQHERLKAFCDALDMEYLVSVFDVMDVPWADSLCKRHKVASRMNQNTEFIQALLNTGKEVIVSKQDWKTYGHTDSFRYMYCITKYPTPKEELDNLQCNSGIGLSSHCPSIEPSLRAIAQGANLIEHHVCFSRDEEGCDKSSSITFEELAELASKANALQII